LIKDKKGEYKMFLMMNTERTATKNIETKKPRDYSKRRKKLYKCL